MALEEREGGKNTEANAREDLKRIMKKREDLEAAIEVLHASLPEPPIVLVDDQGFPRADLDIIDIRTKQNKLVMLQNDHKAVMNEIQQGLTSLHAHRSKAELSSDKNAATISCKLRTIEKKDKSTHEDEKTDESVQKPPVLRPFYLVDNVFDNSPANLARLRIGDRIMRFGGIIYDNVSDKAMADLVKDSIDRQIEVVVHRNPEGILTLRLVPSTWNGRGLLG